MAEIEWLKAIVKNRQDGRTGVVAQGPEDLDSPGGDSSFIFVEYEGAAVLERTPAGQLEITGHVRPEVHPDCFGGNGSDCMFRDNKTCCRYTGGQIAGRTRRPVAMYPACIIDRTQITISAGKKRRKEGGAA